MPDPILSNPVPQQFPKNIKFKYPWRKYQKRVLDELNENLLDKHLHIVAPPGSGKTVLGLEVMVRLNQPTLILAPTVAIRNQWIQRFCELFLQVPDVPDWISKDIRSPGFLTVATYQALHAAYKRPRKNKEGNEVVEGEEGKSRLLMDDGSLRFVSDALKAQKIKTIVVDEAHHLKSEWWHTLTAVKKKLNPVVVGLTATPPYDVAYSEWQNYLALNGPVDAEITVPELVLEGDLCPHQDYVYLSSPTPEEREKIVSFRSNVENLFVELKQDEALLDAFSKHPAYTDPMAHTEWIYSNIACYSAMLIYLHSNGQKIPATHLDIIGDKNLQVPELDFSWMETLMDFFLFREKEYFKAWKDHKRILEKKLRRNGVLEATHTNFKENSSIDRVLTSSLNKLNSIKTIVDFEYKNLGHELRLVILTDFIRKDFLVDHSQNNLPLNKMGVVPIFEKLRRNNVTEQKIGILSGSLVVIPNDSLAAFKEKASIFSCESISYSPLAYDKRYVQIHPTDEVKNHIVRIITEIYEQGAIEILVGTKSLLGEGWDAPAINTLILASFVGSFVLSNQMRGRAIRTQRDNPTKTGNIWHLVCVDPTSSKGGKDIQLLSRRFRGFVGVSFHENAGIENGIGRLNLPVGLEFPKELASNNVATFNAAADRASLKDRWCKALQEGVTLTEEIKIPFSNKEKSFQSTKKLHYNRTIAYCVAELISGFFVFGSQVLQGLSRSVRQMQNLHDFLLCMTVAGVFGLIVFGRKLYKTFRLYIQFRDISKDIERIGKATLGALVKAKVVRTPISVLQVVATADDSGGVYCHLAGASSYEKSAFIQALKEVISPIENPRYLIVRRSKLFNLYQRKDYHAVPELLGQNKNLAKYFKEQWNIYVSKSSLIYTRTIEGRKLLLKYRMRSLANQLEDSIEHVNKWR